MAGRSEETTAAQSTHHRVARVISMVVIVAACGSGDDAADTTSITASTTTTAPATTTTVVVTTSSTAPIPPTTIPNGPICDSFVEAGQTGTVTSSRLTEISGVAASRTQDGVLWVHNDSGDRPVVYAVATGGTLLATFVLDVSRARDWEDIALGPGPEPGLDYLYLGDIGDNNERRDEIVVYRVPEPEASADGSLNSVEALRLRYPDGPHNAEALLVDPLTADLFIVTKEASGRSVLYRAAAPVVEGDVSTLEAATDLDLGPGALVTGGDISPSGGLIALRSYFAVWMWDRPPGSGVAAALSAEPCLAPSPVEPQGEAIAFSPDENAYFTVSEGSDVAIHRVKRQ